jgi:outer membrane receptor protein involved in Fe transport
VATAYVENLTDKYAWAFSQYSEYVKADSIIRPRTIGVKFSYKFGGK